MVNSAALEVVPVWGGRSGFRDVCHFEVETWGSDRQLRCGVRSVCFYLRDCVSGHGLNQLVTLVTAGCLQIISCYDLPKLWQLSAAS
jgi:hypothetical protein